MRLKMGKRVHLCKYETSELAEDVNNLFERKVEIPRVKHGNLQTIDTLINKETLLLTKYLRNEKVLWPSKIN